jgi:hypothetical protein
VPPFFGPAPPASQATQGYSYGQDNSTNPFPPPEGAPRHRPAGRPSGGGRKPPTPHSAAARAVISIVIVLVLAAAGVAAWSVSRSLHHSPTTTPSQSSSSSLSPSAAAAAVPLKPVSASVYNPAPGSNGDDDPTGASAAIDSDTSTSWHTSFYFSPVFGHLKPGAGLILDMGRAVRLSQVAIQFGTSCCTHVQIELGNSSTVSMDALGSFTAVQSSTTAAGVTTFNVAKQTTGRYLLIWMTELPPLASGSGKFETMIYNVTVRGFTAGQSG